MRLGISSGLGASNPEAWAKGLKRIGVKATCFPVDYHSDIKVIDEYVQAAKEADILIAEVGAWSNPMAKDPKVQAAAMERCVEQLKLADYIGANCACNITGSAGEIWDYYYPENLDEKFYDKMVKVHQEIIDRAKPTRTKYSVEPMPWMVPTGPDDFLKFVQDVGEEHMGVHLDMVNWMNSIERIHNQRAFMDDVFAKLHGRIESCHFKDFSLSTHLTFQVKECIIGKGIFDYHYYIQKINEEDPELPLLIEHLNSNQAYIRSMNFVRKQYE